MNTRATEVGVQVCFVPSKQGAHILRRRLIGDAASVLFSRWCGHLFDAPSSRMSLRTKLFPAGLSQLSGSAAPELVRNCGEQKLRPQFSRPQDFTRFSIPNARVVFASVTIAWSWRSSSARSRSARGRTASYSTLSFARVFVDSDMCFPTPNGSFAQARAASTCQRT
jgi:hypothetical protein